MKKYYTALFKEFPEILNRLEECKDNNVQAMIKLSNSNLVFLKNIIPHWVDGADRPLFSKAPFLS